MTPIPENALPNYDKRTIEDPSAFFRTLFHLRDIKEERAIPAVVKDYDEDWRGHGSADGEVHI